MGIDVGGTKTLCVLLDDDCEILETIKFKTAPQEGRAQFTRTLIESVQQLREVAGKKQFKLVAAGVACAGNVDTEKLKILTSPNLIALEDFPVGKYLKRALRVKVVLGNDVRMAIYGEYKLGAARGSAIALGIFFGTGVGSAAIIGGKVYQGANGFGGQVGSALAQPVGGPKAALSHGIVDRIASKAAIAGEALVMAVKEWAPYLHRRVGTDLAKVTWGRLQKAIEHGDERIEEMLRARMRVVGIAVSSVVNFLNPEMIVLGGGLMDSLPKLVLQEFEAGLREYLVPEVGKALKVKAAELGGNAAALGAGFAALESFSQSS